MLEAIQASILMHQRTYLTISNSPLSNFLMALLPLKPLVFLFFLCFHVHAQQNQTHLIRLGSSIFPTVKPTSWPSPSGRFAFGFYRYGNGFAVGIWLVTQPEDIIVWTANRDDQPVSSNATLEFTRDGELLLRTDQGEEKLIADASLGPADSASMLESGNFVLYDRNSSVIWRSFDFPTDTLLEGQNLTYNSKLVSSMSSLDHSTGRFALYMQGDGNLVAYPVNSSYGPDDSYWSSNTAGTFDVKLSLDYRGLLYLTDEESIIKMFANTSVSDKIKMTIYRATLDTDGIFRLYSHSFKNNGSSSVSLEWFALQDQCDVKGFCTFNSYCSSTGSNGECHCYPGFDVVNQSAVRSLSCFENFTGDVCNQDLKQVQYTMTAVENLWWGDFLYSVVPLTSLECSRSCEEDCNCGAALYEGQKCNKYKLPLRYGKRNQNRNTTAFFKVVLASSKSDNTSFPVGPESVIKANNSLFRILSISLASITCFCFFLAITSFLTYRHRVHIYRKLTENGNLDLLDDFTLRSFSYGELEKATNGFEEKLGSGNFGSFYRGILPNGNKPIAVKRLETVAVEGEREFRAEMTTIGRTHHKNLVRLLGFCVDGFMKLLVYEYMSNGSLADNLFNSMRRPMWNDRVRIALDVAKGILYLHEECENHIIHCNIKPQNILLDDFWTAKISDFVSAKLLVPHQTKTNKSIGGTKGYSAPEWQRNALISEKADIYSYGVVLLEIICCRGSTGLNVSTANEIALPCWVYNCFIAGELEKLVEDENVDMKALERMVTVGLWCTQDDPALRPCMKNVILMLEGIMDVPVPPSLAHSLAT